MSLSVIFTIYLLPFWSVRLESHSPIGLKQLSPEMILEFFVLSCNCQVGSLPKANRPPLG